MAGELGNQMLARRPGHIERKEAVLLAQHLPFWEAKMTKEANLNLPVGSTPGEISGAC
jgi:hypothetical protein